MAHPPSDHTPGAMDIREQQATFHVFMALTKWGSLYLAAILMWLTIWFCTDAGFVPGLVSFLVIAVLGTLLLKEKPNRSH
jgi:hypothetical protein